MGAKNQKKNKQKQKQQSQQKKQSSTVIPNIGDSTPKEPGLGQETETTEEVVDRSELNSPSDTDNEIVQQEQETKTSEEVAATAPAPAPVVETVRTHITSSDPFSTDTDNTATATTTTTAAAAMTSHAANTSGTASDPDNKYFNATFTWPAGHHSTVFVTGTFDSWSGSKHPLTRTRAPDAVGEQYVFTGTVPIPYGEKVAYKYVCDGEWLIRDDEAKEWDSAGNVNNVFTAPAKSHAAHTAAAVGGAAAVGAGAAGLAAAHHSEPHDAATPFSVPSSGVSNPEPPVSVQKTEPKSLISAHAPAVTTSTSTAPKSQSQQVKEHTHAPAVEQTSHVKTTGADNIYGLELGPPVTTTNAATEETFTNKPVVPTSTTTSTFAAAPVTTSTTTPKTTTLTSTAGPITTESAAAALGKSSSTTTAASPSSPISPSKLAETLAHALPTTEQAKHAVVQAEETAAAWGESALEGISTAAADIVIGVNDAVLAVTGIDIIHKDPILVQDNQNQARELQGVQTTPNLSGSATGPTALEVGQSNKEISNYNIAGGSATGPTPVQVGQANKEISNYNLATGSVRGPTSGQVGQSNQEISHSQQQLRTGSTGPIHSGATSYTNVPLPSKNASTTSAPYGNANISVAQPSFTRATGADDRTPASKATVTGKTDTSGNATLNHPDKFKSNDPERKPSHKEHDIPAQHATKEANHQTVPQPVIKALSGNTKDRTKPSSEDAAARPISSNPGADAKKVRDEVPVQGANGQVYETNATNAKTQKDDVAPAASTGLPLKATQVPTTGEAAIPPATPAKTTIPSNTATGDEPAPATPNKDHATTATPGSTPGKSHLHESSAATDDSRKRKTSIFGKIKNIFHKKESSTTS